VENSKDEEIAWLVNLKPVEDHVLQGWPHGFGVGDGQWIQDFDQSVTNIFRNN
jgi:hypothetical protein